MTSTNQVVCEYCSTINAMDVPTCMACGGPIHYETQTTPEKPAPIVINLKDGILKNKDLKDVVDSADDVYFTIMKTYSIAWRTAGEAIAIIITSLIIGITAGSAGQGTWGVLGAVLVGIAVGLTRKRFLLALISAPTGAMLGLIFGALFWIWGKIGVIVFIEIGFAVLGAVLGGSRHQGGKALNWWEKSRPFLGAGGGFIFGLFGVIIGIGLRKLMSLA